MKAISELQIELSKLQNTSRVLLVQIKTRKAIANVKRALTLLEKAERTLEWAKRYEPQ